MEEPREGALSGTRHQYVPALDLDELLAQLIDRAQDVRTSHNRLRGLLRANQVITSNLDLPSLLRRIVEVACELLEARYGALGVLRPDGHGLEQFIHVGMTAEDVATIGDLPTGKGVLGALFEDPAAIRLHDLADDPRSVGFPAGHPPMHSFLGVPITGRGQVFGNLYLTERSSGDFSDEDVELANALAATAAVAIENARLYDEAERRSAWTRASAEIAVRLVTADEDALRVVATKVHELAGADLVTLVLPEGPDLIAVAAAIGPAADGLEGSCFPRAGTLSGKVLETGQAMLVTGPDEHPPATQRILDTVPIGPAMLVPLMGADRTRGALMVGRAIGRRQFTDVDLDLASSFADQAAIALELAEARQVKERMKLFEDRDRIARDLHDHVIQQLFASGLTLQGIAMGLTDRSQAERIEQVVEHLDTAIQQIRNSIFELRDRIGTQGSGVRSAVLEVGAELAGALGFEPDIRFIGPVDTVVDEDIAEDLIAVVREALTNVARHAGAGAAQVVLTASAAHVDLRISDDGHGLGETDRRSGLSNLSTRASRRGGTFAVGPRAEGIGTTLIWEVPLAG